MHPGMLYCKRIWEPAVCRERWLRLLFIEIQIFEKGDRMMEVQLRELIEQIKKDGVEVAEAQAKSIVDAANADAQRIIADARAQAEKIIADAKAENDRIVKSGEDAIAQAGRNLLISFRESVTRELKAVTEKNVAEVCSSPALADLILQTVEAWAKNPDTEDLAVILNQHDQQALESLHFQPILLRTCGPLCLALDDFRSG